MKKITFAFALLFLFVAGCNKNKNIPPEILDLENKISKENQLDYVDELNNKYIELLKDTNLAKDEKKLITERAFDLFDKVNKPSISSYYLYELLKNYKLRNHKDRIKEFINLIEKNGNKEISNTMKILYADSYPDDKEFIGAYNEQIASKKIDFDVFLKSISDKIYQDLEKTGKANLLEARNYINNCEIYALIKPEDENSAKYLYMGAQIAQNIKMFIKTLELYDWIIVKYPDYSKSANSMFMKAFILDNELKRFDEAREVYNEFLTKYPKSDLADDVTASLEFLGKSDEEILKTFESKSHQK